ncbi:glycerol-3-phosphate dehydrogenase C-terminal domain-containing protein, partial [Azospirillum sp. TSO22-1]|uniref:glycerol-3-phosphate dehydrogenase C-terminal domain-containing protein n=1 Tax=Azospirillum sp. TSO22-1 TaxID=716789 RepID=UPI000D611AD8
DAPEGGAPLLSVFGGKITTYRKLAEAALAKLAPHLPLANGSWSSRVPLPGGDFPVDETGALIAELRARYPFVAPEHMARLVRTYGTRTWDLLGDAAGPVDLGRRFGGDLTEAEVRYLMAEEWAQTAEDVLWRRTKLGLRLGAAEADALDAWMAEVLEGVPARVVNG